MTSFDLRFDDCLKRLSEHKGLFDIELRAGRHASLESFVGKVIEDLRERDQLLQDDEVVEFLRRGKKTCDGRCQI